MAKCAKCGSDHDDPRVNRKLAERAFTLFAVVAVLEAIKETAPITNIQTRTPFILTSVAAFVGLNVGMLACVVETLGMAKVSELAAANMDPNAWVKEQAAAIHGGIDLSAVQRKVTAWDMN